MIQQRALAGAALALIATAAAACGASSPVGPTRSASVAPPPSTAGGGSGIAYAALGASETFGVGATTLAGGYAYRIRDALGVPGARFADAGIPAATVGVADRIELSSALAVHPTVCTAFFGVNDIRRGIPLPQFASDLTNLATALRRANCRVLIIGLPNLVDLPALRALPASLLAGITQQWNERIRQIAATTGSAFLALDTLSDELATHPDELAADGLHPSDKGHARLAEVVLAALRSNGYVPR